MARRLEAWQPTPDEVQRIVDEMRPIIQDFARRSALECERDERVIAGHWSG